MPSAPEVSGTSTPAREPADLRLLPFTASVWLAQATVLLIRSGIRNSGLQGVAVGLLVILACLGVASWIGAGRSAVRRPTGAILMLLTCAGLGLGLCVGMFHVKALSAFPLSEVAEQRSVVKATLKVTGDPRPHLVPGRASGTDRTVWSSRGRLLSLEIRGQQFKTQVPVALRGESVASMRYGSIVEVSARAAPAFAPAEHAMVLGVLARPVELVNPGPLARATTAVRVKFRAACSGLPRDAGALLLGLAVGDESTLPSDLDLAMLRTGLSHLTAVSGSNTSLVAGLALAAATAIGLGFRSRLFVAGMVLASYVALVRPQPSVVRAAAMGSVALFALAAGGRRRGAPALLASILVLLIAIPSFAVSLGFALSVAATAGLLVVGPHLLESLTRWRVTRGLPQSVLAALAVATAAHLATLPLTLLMGNGASLVALPANMIVTPLVPVATVLGLAAALVAPLAPGLAAVVAHLASPATAGIAAVARVGAHVPGGVVAIPAGPMSAVVALALLALAALFYRGWRPWRDTRWLAFVAVAMGSALIAQRLFDEKWPPPDWLVLVCDVGQGDAVLVRESGSSDALLVDAGPEPSAVRSCLRDAGIRRVVVILSHFHADHIGGLPGVFDSATVTALLTSPVAEPASGARQVHDQCARAGVSVQALRAGQRFGVGGIDIQVLWPARRIAESPANNASVVVVADVPVLGRKPMRVLLPGDVEPAGQTPLLAMPSPSAEVVKVPHHGSGHQLSDFAEWSGAEIALITVGRGNDYGHPNSETISKYEAVGAAVGRTDLQGALAVRMSDGRPQLVTQH